MFCFIILHYKNIKDTLECISSIHNLKNQKNIRIVVVDNNTTTVKQEKILKEKCNIFIRLPENVGFAKANNIGCANAIKKFHPDFLIVINNDIVIYELDLLEKIKKDYSDYHFDMLGPKILTNGGESVNPFPVYNSSQQVKRNYIKTKVLVHIYHNKFISWLFEKYLFFKSKIKKPTHLQNGEHLEKQIALHGCAICFSKKYYEKYHYVFYPNTFLYHEEEFLYYRIQKDKLISIYDPQIEVFHKEGSSLNFRFSSSEREKKLFRYREIEKSLKQLLQLYDKEEEKNGK